jgi:hypothetical protein
MSPTRAHEYPEKRRDKERERDERLMKEKGRKNKVHRTGSAFNKLFLTILKLFLNYS